MKKSAEFTRRQILQSQHVDWRRYERKASKALCAVLKTFSQWKKARIILPFCTTQLCSFALVPVSRLLKRATRFTLDYKQYLTSFFLLGKSVSEYVSAIDGSKSKIVAKSQVFFISMVTHTAGQSILLLLAIKWALRISIIIQWVGGFHLNQCSALQ